MKRYDLFFKRRPLNSLTCTFSSVKLAGLMKCQPIVKMADSATFIDPIFTMNPIDRVGWTDGRRSATASATAPALPVRPPFDGHRNVKDLPQSTLCRATQTLNTSRPTSFPYLTGVDCCVSVIGLAARRFLLGSCFLFQDFFPYFF